MNTNTASADTDTRAMVVTAAGQLAERVRDGEVYQAFQQQVSTLQSDSEALGVLQDFQYEQQQLAAAQQYGMASEEQIRELQEKEASMMAHPVLAGFFAAQQALIDELSEVNAAISARLGYDFAKLAQPATGCGSGCGSHGEGGCC
ncbi:YlbF family regulator [Spirochaeta africana]|uniref:Cell fate regulator YlbF, YheA/YmcA/DUF963 family (Controls sporulation, competence, biofilm development) n=1 Tax=Spirochaeta africana (strain ATCC 700263 / DSM 8902 / Z-7692) TaxID=889378 RepID=H9UFT0_SPIAZ|nr:YlbF family regulator [Spirochaeta africana]AFG36373.1 hypothetical protein Spiaf_0265 [Spirochaeta africana DSM 8902]